MDILSWGILLVGRRNWWYLVEILKWVNCWCPPGTTFRSEDQQAGLRPKTITGSLRPSTSNQLGME